MTTETRVPLVHRILQLMDHLKIQSFHVVGALPGDRRDLATISPDRIASLGLVCPSAFEPSTASSIAPRVLVFHGDRGPIAERVRAAVAQLPDATRVTLTDYAGLPFADIGLNRRVEIGSALLEFLQRASLPPVAILAATRENGRTVPGLRWIAIEGSLSTPALALKSI